ncbi:hypothetical protein [Cohnella mopanensis]|uniref:hypothetical protein n=1 Tax=Cohnella mopanensis TaxID=2911966 RepID=UPI001EF8FFFA|nr:hypothetical protein [Cohnella mopanensis]
MIHLLERPPESVELIDRYPIAYDDLEDAIRNRRMLSEQMNSLESKCRTELKGLQAELDQLLIELSRTLESARP